MPTNIPSSMPSNAPTISHIPSAYPSISHSPTYYTVSGTRPIYSEDGIQGVQSGCPVPSDRNAADFAEVAVLRDPLEFKYSIISKTESPVTEEDIRNFEVNLNQEIFDSYIDCGFNRRLEQGDSISSPIGVSSLPVDGISTASECTSTNDGESCIVLDGSITLLFEAEANYALDREEALTLGFVKTVLSKIEVGNNITEVRYLGTTIDDSLGGDNIFVVPRLEQPDESDTTDDNTSSPYSIIAVAGMSCLSLVVVFYTIMKIRARRRLAKDYKDEEALMSPSESIQGDFCEERKEKMVFREGRLVPESECSPMEEQDVHDAMMALSLIHI